MPPKKKVFTDAHKTEYVVQERINQLARNVWLTKEESTFDGDVIQRVYKEELVASGFSQRRAMALEFSRYLEKYLWFHYNPKLPEQCTRAHIMSLVAVVNEKCRERVPAWKSFIERPDDFSSFFNQILKLCLDDYSVSENDATERDLLIQEEILAVIFLNHCFNSLSEESIICDQLKRIVSLGMWHSLREERREAELALNDKYRRLFKAMQKRDSKLDTVSKEKLEWERSFLPRLLDRFIDRLEKIGDSETDPFPDQLLIHYLERCLLLVIDLESMLLTRRYFNTLMDDKHLVVRCALSHLIKRPEGKLFGQLVDMLRFYASFEIDDSSGEALTLNEVDRRHCDNILRLQHSMFTYDSTKLRTLCVANVGKIEKGDLLRKELQKLDKLNLEVIASSLKLISSTKDSGSFGKEFLIQILVHRFSKKPSQLTYINSLPLYPTEQVIWDENRVPVEHCSGGECLALPKLSLQYLTLHDYLLRNFNLFHLESTYEIRQDIESAVSRLKPWRSELGEVVFGGWSRMAVPITNFSIIEVGKPHLGFNHPSRVRADISVTLSTRLSVKQEWESLRKFDPCFLITVRPSMPYGYKYNFREAFIPQVGLAYVRGCEIEGLLDTEGKVIPEEERDSKLPTLQGSDVRTWRVKLDPCQYQIDVDAINKGRKSTTVKKVDMDSNNPDVEDVYDTFNILLRRKPKENNFKAVLETIRDLMNTNCVVPDWLQDLLLGYEDPSSAHYSRMKGYQIRQDWRDTFLDADHLKANFRDYDIEFVDKRRSFEKNMVSTETLCPPPPYRLIFPNIDADTAVAKRREGSYDTDASIKPKLIAESYSLPYRPSQLLKCFGEVVKSNSVRFTSTQTEAIRAGMQPGLTMIVGPPGTGKTDVAVQIINNIYHNYPNQRTLIVTHSNQALNQLFEKIMALDIDERHLLRLGHGEEALETEKDFSKYGRVNFVLAKRLELLRTVERLAANIDDVGFETSTSGSSNERLPAYTCETAQHLYLHVVLSKWQAFLNQIATSSKSTEESTAETVGDIYDPDIIRSNFPFLKFFLGPNPTADMIIELFPGVSREQDLAMCQAAFHYIENIFSQLDEFRAFELMRTGVERANFLLIQEAKIIAMTCTHAALRRRDLVALGFTYDNILMEEAAQILEIETFIPLLLQNPDLSGNNRLKRWVMIGDHHQLPPVVKNMAFQNFSNMSQSLFARLVKLGVPSVQLDAQGRARSSLARLYSWRYKVLDDLPHVIEREAFQLSNPGFAFEYQMLDVQDFQGVGESEPSPYFYQNLAEAEYVVAVFMYMRLVGYPAESISILTTYNGQKHLIRDVINNRCADNPLIGRPSKITTVDRFQGQQNDYILLSLVRTRTVGHLRDVRRLVVAMSRARLGLYIFGRVSLFESCHELKPAFRILTQRPTQLHLTPWEDFYILPTVERTCQQPPQRPAKVVRNMSEMANFVFEFYNHRLGRWMEEHRRLQQWQGDQRPPSSLPQPPKEKIISSQAPSASDSSGTSSDAAPSNQQTPADSASADNPPSSDDIQNPIDVEMVANSDPSCNQAGAEMGEVDQPSGTDEVQSSDPPQDEPEINHQSASDLQEDNHLQTDVASEVKSVESEPVISSDIPSEKSGDDEPASKKCRID